MAKSFLFPGLQVGYKTARLNEMLGDQGPSRPNPGKPTMPEQLSFFRSCPPWPMRKGARMVFGAGNKCITDHVDNN